MKWLRSVAGLLIIASGGAAAQQALEFRGIPLGITLGTFRKLPFPDKTDRRITITCTGDAAAARVPPEELSILPDLASVGVIACSYFIDLEGLGPMGWAPAFAGIGNYQTTFSFLSPAEKRRESAVFYSVYVRAENSHYAQVVEALGQKYGQPSEIFPVTKDAGTGQEIFPNTKHTGIGQELQDEIVDWKVGRGHIAIEKYADRINMMSVEFLLDDHFFAVKQMVKEMLQKRAAGQL